MYDTVSNTSCKVLIEVLPLATVNKTLQHGLLHVVSIVIFHFSELATEHPRGSAM